MKLFKENVRNSRELKVIMVFSLLIFASCCISVIYGVNFTRNRLKVTNIVLSNLDILYSFNDWGIICDTNFYLIIIPIFSALIIYIINYNNNFIRIIRFKTRDNLWNHKIFFIIIASLLLSIVLTGCGYLIGGIILKGFSYPWTLDNTMPYKVFEEHGMLSTIHSALATYKVLITFCTTTFLGLSFLGILICTLKLILNDVYVYIILMGLIVMEEYKIIGFKFITRVIVFPSYWLNPGSLIINYMFFLFGFFILYFVGRFINSKRDQCISKKY